ncbi:MAG: hypothetical protein LBS98_05445 [Coriobacteriales bacterium]|jgi:hypothetical protein|nr:hypothetical protein [Coriobacteriales bacterium]
MEKGGEPTRHFIDEDGREVLEVHSSNPSHSFHRYSRLGGFLIAIIVITALSIGLSLLAPLVSGIQMDYLESMMRDPQVAEMMPPDTLAQAVQAASIYSNPLYMVFYILELAAQVAFLVAIITRNRLYLVLFVALFLLNLLGFAISLLFIQTELVMTLIQALIILLYYGALVLYFVKSKRVEVYFKGTWEKIYLGT